MQNLYETVKKAQMVVQVEAVRVQKELAAYNTINFIVITFFNFSVCRIPQYFLFMFAEQSLMVTVKAS